MVEITIYGIIRRRDASPNTKASIDWSLPVRKRLQEGSYSDSVNPETYASWLQGFTEAQNV